VVYRDGLENRYGLTAIGGSNPSPSARLNEERMKENLGLIIAVVAIGVIFGVLWRMGYLVRLSNYIAETREELRKCTWPSRAELKGSTLVVVISILILGVFTMVIDFFILSAVRWVIS
jgi:preprotein translocase subunit SecE